MSDFTPTCTRKKGNLISPFERQQEQEHIVNRITNGKVFQRTILTPARKGKKEKQNICGEGQETLKLGE